MYLGLTNVKRKTPFKYQSIWTASYEHCGGLKQSPIDLKDAKVSINFMSSFKFATNILSNLNL